MLLAACAASAGVERHHNVIAGRDLRHRAADPLDDPGALVPKHDRLRNRERLVAHGDVGVADARRHDANQDLVVARVFEVHRLKRHRRVRRPRHRGQYLHLPLPADRQATPAR